MKEGWKGFFTKHKKKVLFGIVILLLFLFFFGTKMVLYMQFLLGNDIVIDLKQEVEEMTIVHGEERDIEVEVTATANPFCEVSCQEKWIDLAQRNVVKKESMILYPGVSSTRRFSIMAKWEDERYLLYRYEVACQGQESVLCHTSENPTEREVLVKVHVALNNEEKKKKEELNSDLNKKVEELETLKRIAAWEAESVAIVNGTILQGRFNWQVEKNKNIVQNEERWMEDAQALWKEQQFTAIEELIAVSKMDESITVVRDGQQMMNGTVEEYNLFVKGLNELKDSLQQMQEKLPLFNQSVNEKGMLLSEKYNLLLKDIFVVDFKISTQLFEKLNGDKAIIGNGVEKENEKEQKEKGVELLLNKRVVCEIAGVCGNVSSIKEIIESEDTVTERCGEVKKFIGEYSLLQMQMKEAVKSVGYAQDVLVLENVSKYIHTVRENEKAKMVLELQAVNESGWGSELLKPEIKEIVNFAANVNVTPLAVIAMNSLVQECSLPNVTLTMLENVTIEPIMLPELKGQIVGEKFGKQVPKCCVLGSCTSCCIQKSCGEYPILFIHGHAFNKDLSAEYSLNAFNGLQTKLEEEGYVKAGVVSLYKPIEERGEKWGEFASPMSVKGSYYYDTYFTAGGYTLVQQKSERIETYALRLKELIETVQYKTGRDKVIIVAHSMGGLVARRYMQLFGEESVDRLIMIGTPNKGVVGNVAEYCDIIGEQRECEDMNSKSLFIGKLNAGKKPSVPTSVIVGIGCEMDEKEGDGVVLKENAHLEGAKTYFVKGNCEGLLTWHTEMLQVDKYPEVYKAIVAALNG